LPSMPIRFQPFRRRRRAREAPRSSKSLRGGPARRKRGAKSALSWTRLARAPPGMSVLAALFRADPRFAAELRHPRRAPRLK
jgi:hypothetical protein